MGLASIKDRINHVKRKYSHFWQLILGFVSLVVVFILGIIGYMTVEGWRFLDSFYMVVITLATVGFQEVHPLSDSGRLMTALLILSGVGSFAYLVGSFSQFLVEGRLQALWWRLKVQKKIDKLQNHFIVCGYGRIGSIVVREIMKEGLPIVVVEQKPHLIERMEQDGVLCLDGDATNDEVLLRAGLKRARSIIAALSDEAANVYVTLTARQLSPSIQIVARANEKGHVPRLEMAGADRVVMPHFIGGIRMAQSILRPTVTNFLDLAVRGEVDLQMEELPISSSSEIVGKDLIESQIRPRFNLIIIAIKRASGDMVFNPGPKEVLEAGDTMMLVGRRSDLKRLQEIL